MKTFLSKFGIPLTAAVVGGLIGAVCVKGASANQTDLSLEKHSQS